jgi:hypothetical protein
LSLSALPAARRPTILSLDRNSSPLIHPSTCISKPRPELPPTEISPPEA